MMREARLNLCVFFCTHERILLMREEEEERERFEEERREKREREREREREKEQTSYVEQDFILRERLYNTSPSFNTRLQKKERERERE